MWWVDECVYIWIGLDRIHCGMLTGRGSRAVWKTLAELPMTSSSSREALSLASLTPALRQLPSQLAAQGIQMGRDKELRVVVHDRWLSLASMPWSPELMDEGRASESVLDHLREMGFEVHRGDTVRLDDAPYGQPRLAVVYSAALLLAIQDLAGALHLRWCGVRALSVLAWDTLSRLDDLKALVVMDGPSDGLLAWGASKGAWGRSRLLEVKPQNAVSASSVSKAAQLLWSRWQLRQPALNDVHDVKVVTTSTPEQGVLSLAAPLMPMQAPWNVLQPSALWLDRYRGVHALDAYAKSGRPGWRAVWTALMLLMAMGGVMIAAMGWWEARQARASYESLLGASVVPAPAVVPLSKEERDRMVAVNEAIRQLNVPIDDVLQALRPPRDLKVAVLSVETSGGATGAVAKNTVKITAESPSSADMTRYVAFVADHRPFVNAYLIRHEVPDGAEGRFRFTLEAQWNE